jgi:acid phosphatase
MSDHSTLRRLILASLVAAAMLVAGVNGALAADKPVGCEPPPKPQRLDGGQPINIGLLQKQLVYYRCNRYDTEVAAVLRRAQAYVVREAPRMIKRGKKPALVLDIDETSLSNWKQIYQNGFAYIAKGECSFDKGYACSQEKWELSASGEVIGPTHDLFEAAKANKVAVFFITERYESPDERAATVKNLELDGKGYTGYEHLYMRDGNFNNVSEFKASIRKKIEDELKYTIIANVGDQISDLAGDDTGEHAKRCFKIPNPFYFIAGNPVPRRGPRCLRD